MVLPGKEIAAASDLRSIEVIALVGPSGTGKSHHAMWVAQEHGCQAIIDDGLLISGSRIVAGRSAKREETKTAAVRRAVFTSPGHALEVRSALEDLGFRRVLVLGTSASMIQRIISRLGLTKPLLALDIRELASEEEVREALWRRRQEGKHVIPAPTFEVKKTFSGYLVDPLQIFMKSREKKATILERSVVRPTYSYFGNFYIADNVVMQMATRICHEVEGVKRVLKALVLTTSEGAILEVELVLSYGTQVFSVMSEVQAKLKQRLEYLTGIYLLNVDVITKKIGID
ncbi:MAG TPA: Asp23/Gls24 family envelope stress response protein [Firmicutes bacterium]|nr:Asp23/Gls24 family envelope stress response protein [Candidatus Fermentithermobacillaceae bacterium]